MDRDGVHIEVGVELHWSGEGGWEKNEKMRLVQLVVYLLLGG